MNREKKTKRECDKAETSDEKRQKITREVEAHERNPPLYHPEQFSMLLLRTQAHDEIRRAYNNVHHFHHSEYPRERFRGFLVFEEVNAIVAKWSKHLLQIDAASIALLLSLQDLSKKAMEDFSKENQY